MIWMYGLIGVLGIIIFGLLSYLFWYFATYYWLPKIGTALIFALPFERIPGLDVGGANIRLSQLLVLFGFWVFIILLIKKDKKLLSRKIHPANIFLVLFIVASSISWFFVEDLKRFLVTYIATLI